MAGARRSETTAPAGDLPDEIYIAFVDGLVTDIIVPIGLSAVAVMCGEIAAAIAAGQPLLAYAATSQLLIATVRLHFAKRHARSLGSSLNGVGKAVFWVGLGSDRLGSILL